MIVIRDLKFEDNSSIDLEDLKRLPYGWADCQLERLSFYKLLIDGHEIDKHQELNETIYSHNVTVKFLDDAENEHTCSFDIIGLSNDSIISLDNHELDLWGQGFFALYFPKYICIIRSRDERLYSTLFKNDGIILGVDGETALFYKDGKRGICNKKWCTVDYRYDEVYNIFDDYTGARHISPYYKRFKSIRRFNNNTYVVRKGGAFGIINENGFEIIPCRYEGIKKDCVVVCGKVARYYPENGAISDLFDDIQQLGKIRIGKQDGKITYWDYLDRYHDVTYEQIKGFSYSIDSMYEPRRKGYKDFFVITNGNKHSFINYYGHTILELQGYDIVDVDYDVGCYSVWGSLNIEDLKLSDVELFNDSLLFKKEGILSKRVLELRDRFFKKEMYDEWNFNFHNLRDEYLDKYEIVIYVKKDGNIGVMNKSGEIIVSPIHTDIRNARTSYVSYKRIVNTQGFIGQENINTE